MSFFYCRPKFKFRTTALKGLLSLFVVASIFALQLHELSHANHLQASQDSYDRALHGPKASCDICEVRAHTPALKAAESPQFLSQLVAEVAASGFIVDFVSAEQLRLPYSRGPPAILKFITI